METRNPNPQPPSPVLRLIALQRRMRDTLLAALRTQGDAMADVAENHNSDGDTIYRIDEKGEDVLFAECEAWGRETPFILVAEGVPGNGWRAFPESASLEDARFFLIVDPIDGTREIMYDKRSAWALAAIAPNNGPNTNLADVTMAVMTELPTTRHLYGDTLWAVRGGGVHAQRQNLLTGAVEAFTPRPSHANTVAHGFASITKFFPGSKIPAAQIEERLFAEVLGGVDGANPLAFDDQYVSTGGQLYELIVGHDRFNADLRPVFLGSSPARLCCHPYDICTELIAREAGVIVTDERGQSIAVELDIRCPVSWVGFANARIRDQLWPVLERLIGEYRPA